MRVDANAILCNWTLLAASESSYYVPDLILLTNVNLHRVYKLPLSSYSCTLSCVNCNHYINVNNISHTNIVRSIGNFMRSYRMPQPRVVNVLNLVGTLDSVFNYYVDLTASLPPLRTIIA